MEGSLCGLEVGFKGRDASATESVVESVLPS